MSKSLILTTGAPGTTAAGSTIPVGNIVRRFGQGFTNTGNGIIISQPGYYNIDASVTFTGTEGDVTIDIQQNGTTISGATATETIGTASTEVHSLTIPTTARVYCSSLSTISVTVDAASKATPNISNFSLRITKE